MEITKIIKYRGATPTAKLFVHENIKTTPRSYLVLKVSSLGNLMLTIWWVRTVPTGYRRYYVLIRQPYEPGIEPTCYDINNGKRIMKEAI